MATRTNAAEAEANGEDFCFTHNGKEYCLPMMSKILSGVLRRSVMKFPDNELGQIFAILEEVAEPKTIAALDEKTTAELNDVIKDWQRHSAAGLGE